MNDRLKKLRTIMSEKGIDVYLIPTSDFHESEYVGAHFKCREFLTGFTGSAGTAVVTQGVPTVNEYLEQAMPQGGVLGFDGRVVNSSLGKELEELLETKQVSFSYEEDLVGGIWENRPSLSAEPVWILDEKYTGKPASQKIEELRKAMKEEHADVHVLTTLDDIVWLLNIRGGDVPHNPVVLSYVVVTVYQ